MLFVLGAFALGTAAAFASQWVTSLASPRRRVRAALRMPMGMLLFGGLLGLVVGVVFSPRAAGWLYLALALVVALSDVGEWRLARRLRGLPGAEPVVDWELVRLAETSLRKSEAGRSRLARRGVDLAGALIVAHHPKTALEVLKLIDPAVLSERERWDHALKVCEAWLKLKDGGNALVALNAVSRPLPHAQSEAMFKWMEAMCLSVLGRYPDAETRLDDLGGGLGTAARALVRAHQAVAAGDEPAALSELEVVGPALLSSWVAEGLPFIPGPAERLARTVAARATAA